MTPAQLRSAAAVLTVQAAARDHEATDLGRSLDAAGRASEEIAEVWTSPVADRLRTTATDRLAALRDTPEALLDSRRAISELSERAAELAEELAGHLAAATTAADEVGRLSHQLLNRTLEPEHATQVRQQLDTARQDRRSAESRADDTRARWDAACRTAATRIGSDASVLRRAVGAAGFEFEAGEVTFGQRGEQLGLGEDLAEDVASLLDGDIADHYDELAALLAQLEGADEDVLAGFWGSLDADQVHLLLWQIHDAHERGDPGNDDRDFFDRNPTEELLEPLGLAFAEAGRLDLFSEAFLTDLVRGGPPVTGPFDVPPPTMELVGQLLIHGDPMAQGNPVLTARLAEIVLAPGFLQRMQHSLGNHHRYFHGDRERGEGVFSAEAQFHRALDHLAGSPEASHLFLLHPPNQTALVDHASEGLGFMTASWGPELEGHMAAIIEQGLLTWPAQEGHFDGAIPLATHDALVHLIRDVGGRDRIPASLAPALASILLPHADTVADAANQGRAAQTSGRPTLRLGDDAGATMEDYLSRVVRHDGGLDALADVTSLWSQVSLLEHADSLLDRGVVTADVDGPWLASTQSMKGVHLLVGESLERAGRDRDAQARYLSLVLGEGSRQARSRSLSALGLSGGPKGWLAAQAASWADRQITPRIEEALLPSPVDTGDFDAMLAHTMPNLAATTLLAYADERAAGDPDLSVGDLVPVAPGLREVEFDRDTSWGVLPWVDTTEVREVPIEEWPHSELVDWVDRNRSELGTSSSGSLDDWWIGWVVSQQESLYPPPYGSGS